MAKQKVLKPLNVWTINWKDFTSLLWPYWNIDKVGFGRVNTQQNPQILGLTKTKYKSLVSKSEIH